MALVPCGQSTLQAELNVTVFLFLENKGNTFACQLSLWVLHSDQEIHSLLLHSLQKEKKIMLGEEQ